MAGRHANHRRRGGSDTGSHWISYSDMMASLLMVFVLAVVYSVYQYYNMLDIKTQQLNQQQAELERATITLVQREAELDEANVTLVGKQKELAALQIQLDEQEDTLHAAQTALKTKEEEQAALQLQLAEQADQLAAMRLVLNAQKEELLSSQQQLDALLGVKTAIIQDLTAALNRASLRASVDETTGDIILESAVFFDSNRYEVKDSGKDFLSSFIPVYLGVLLQDKYIDYVGEIIIEGHTDDAGSYVNNLTLSQNRAQSVAKYCLEMPSLTARQVEQMERLLTVTGRSEADLIYETDAQGNILYNYNPLTGKYDLPVVDKEASRRVEFKFRMKDTEMIDEMNRILSELEQ